MVVSFADYNVLRIMQYEVIIPVESPKQLHYPLFSFFIHVLSQLIQILAFDLLNETAEPLLQNIHIQPYILWLRIPRRSFQNIIPVGHSLAQHRGK